MGSLGRKERELRRKNYRKLLDEEGRVVERRVRKLIEFIASDVQQDVVTRRALQIRGATESDIGELVDLGVLRRVRARARFKVVTDPLAGRADPSDSAGSAAPKPKPASASQLTLVREPERAAEALARLDGVTSVSTRKRDGKPAVSTAKPAPGREPLAAWAASHADPVPVAPEERAFEVFHDEHRGRFKDGLFSGVPQTEAGVVRLDPEVEDYIAHPGADGAIAIIENRGTFQSLKRLLVARGEVALYGERIAGVVYKAGRPTAPDLANLYRAYGLPAAKPLLYWGDIDRSGARELLSMRSRAGGGNPIPAIRPWTGAYRAQASCGLADFYNGLDLEPAADAGIDIASVEAAAGAMVDGDARLETFVLATLHLVRRIPQETLSFTDFMRDAVPLDPARKAD